MEGKRSYLLLEHVSGQTLRQIVVSRGPQDEQKALEWSRQIIELLEFLHVQQPPVVHRDISPENLIVRSTTGQVTLIGFGAASYHTHTHTSTLIGKQHYMAPEQIQGRALEAACSLGLGPTPNLATQQ